jgi:hypothetical protein
MAGPACDDLPVSKIHAVDCRYHQRHPAGRALLLRVGFPFDGIGASARMTFRAIPAQGGGHDAHRVHEIVHRDAFEDLDVLEDGLGPQPGAPFVR